MSFSFGFFNAKNMDRTYTAEDFTGYLSSIICNGVFDTYGDCFSVTAGNGTSVVIGTGKAWIDGHYFINGLIIIPYPELLRMPVVFKLADNIIIRCREYT